MGNGFVDPVVENDADTRDGAQPPEGYAGIYGPMDAAINDQRNAQDTAQSEDILRRAAAQQQAPSAPVPSAASYARAPARPAGAVVSLVPADGTNVQMQIVQEARAQERQDQGSNNREALDQPRGNGEVPHDVVTYAELQAQVHALQEAANKMQADADIANNNQNHLAAEAAKARRVRRLNTVLGVTSIISMIGTLVYTILTQPKPNTGPNAVNITGGLKLDPSKPASVDVASQATPGNSKSAIDVNSIELKSHDDGDVKRMTLKDTGVWLVNTDGTVQFTPDPKFPGGTVSIAYSIGDVSGARSQRAQIDFGFQIKAQPGTGGPVVQSVEQTNLITDDIAIDVVATAKPGPSGAAVKADSIVLLDADAATPQTRFVRGVGTWTADVTGKIAFVPTTGFTGGTAEQSFTIADVNGNTSDSGSISLYFYKRIKAFDLIQQVDSFVAGTVISVNVLDGSAGGPKPIADPQLAVDPASVILTGVLKNEDEEQGPDASATNNMKRIEVANEGSWDASDATGVVTFTPLPNLSGTPHTVTYQVGDTKGVLSNVAMLSLSSDVSKVVAALGAVNALDDATFWSKIDSDVIKGDLGDDPVNKLAVLRGVITDLWLNTRDGIDDDQRDIVFSQRDALLRGVLSPEFEKWRADDPSAPDGPLTPERLFRLSQAFDDAKVALPGVKLATRYVRLTYMQMLISYFQRVMSNNSNNT